MDEPIPYSDLLCGSCGQPVSEWRTETTTTDEVTWTQSICQCGHARFVRADKGELDIGVIT